MAGYSRRYKLRSTLLGTQSYQRFSLATWSGSDYTVSCFARCHKFCPSIFAFLVHLSSLFVPSELSSNKKRMPCLLYLSLAAVTSNHSLGHYKKKNKDWVKSSISAHNAEFDTSCNLTLSNENKNKTVLAGCSKTDHYADIRCFVLSVNPSPPPSLSYR